MAGNYSVNESTILPQAPPTSKRWPVPTKLPGAGSTKQSCSIAERQMRVVLEATGKLEHLAASELAAAGLPVAVVNPGQVRHYAKARGKRAKTDKIDARLIAEFARDLQPE